MPTLSTVARAATAVIGRCCAQLTRDGCRKIAWFTNGRSEKLRRDVAVHGSREGVLVLGGVWLVSCAVERTCGCRPTFLV